MVQGPSWEANCFAASQEIPPHLIIIIIMITYSPIFLLTHSLTYLLTYWLA